MKDQTVLHKGSKYSFLYQNREVGSKSILLNRDDARIIDECDGKSSIDQIINRLAVKYDENYDNLVERVGSFFSSNDYFNIMDKPTNNKIREMECPTTRTGIG
ncbi:MAG: PqqD family peptide modification chaperone [Methanobacterium sp.]|nr:PqqD family peptide modification chaperone [Methanobacterium sp.]